MSSYFDEHNCEPLGAGEAPNHFLHFARLLLDSGWGAELQLEFGNFFSEGKPAPPAGKAAVEALERTAADRQKTSQQCPICILEFEENIECVKMPCEHHFHSECILLWLKKTNSCPVCRWELETDDSDYEEFKKQKKRKEEREKNIEELHDSMFS